MEPGARSGGSGEGFSALVPAPSRQWDVDVDLTERVEIDAPMGTGTRPDRNRRWGVRTGWHVLRASRGMGFP